MYYVGNKASLCRLKYRFGIGARLCVHAEDAVVTGELALEAELIAGVADHGMKEKERFQNRLKEACHVVPAADVG